MLSEVSPTRDKRSTMFSGGTPNVSHTLSGSSSVVPPSDPRPDGLMRAMRSPTNWVRSLSEEAISAVSPFSAAPRAMLARISSASTPSSNTAAIPNCLRSC